MGKPEIANRELDMQEAATQRQAATLSVLDPARILVVDDDPTIRELSLTALESEFGTPGLAANGEEAFELLTSEPFDIALVDLEMPVMDGFSLIELIRERQDIRNIPIIVITGRDDVVAIERAYSLGATSFVCKPINWTLFRHTVRYVLRAVRMEADARETTAKVEILSRLKDNFLTVLDHEVRSSLNSTIGFADILQTADLSSPNSTNLKVIASDIAKGSHGLLDTVHYIMDSLRIIVGEIETKSENFCFSEIIARAIEDQAMLMRDRGVAILVNDETDGAAITGDRALLGKAFSALIENAVALTKQGSEVRIRAFLLPDRRVRTVISDQGPGLDHDRIRSCVEPFVCHSKTITRAGRSPLGLGIPVAKAVFRAHKGHLGLISEPGSGLEAIVTLPLSK